jgi:hypothetical protein
MRERLYFSVEFSFCCSILSDQLSKGGALLTLSRPCGKVAFPSTQLRDVKSFYCYDWLYAAGRKLLLVFQWVLLPSFPSEILLPYLGAVLFLMYHSTSPSYAKANLFLASR